MKKGMLTLLPVLPLFFGMLIILALTEEQNMTICLFEKKNPIFGHLSISKIYIEIIKNNTYFGL